MVRKEKTPGKTMNSPKINKDEYSLIQAAKILKLDKEKLLLMIHHGKVAFRRKTTALNNYYFIPAEEVERLLAQQKQHGQEKKAKI